MPGLSHPVGLGASEWCELAVEARQAAAQGVGYRHKFPYARLVGCAVPYVTEPNRNVLFYCNRKLRAE